MHPLHPKGTNTDFHSALSTSENTKPQEMAWGSEDVR